MCCAGPHAIAGSRTGLWPSPCREYGTRHKGRCVRGRGHQGATHNRSEPLPSPAERSKQPNLRSRTGGTSLREDVLGANWRAMVTDRSPCHTTLSIGRTRKPMKPWPTELSSDQGFDSGADRIIVRALIQIRRHRCRSPPLDVRPPIGHMLDGLSAALGLDPS
jgi:hypothetical protein